MRPTLLKQSASLLAPLLIINLLAGCSTINALLDPDSAIDYKSTKQQSTRLEVPPDLTPVRGSDRFIVKPGTVSAVEYAAGTSAAAQAAGASSTAVLPDNPGVRMVRDGNQRWLVLDNVTAEKAYPILAEFWKELGFVLAIDSPQTGVIETDWAENRAKIAKDPVRAVLSKIADNLYDSGERDKFRTRIERTPSGKGVEVFLAHRGMQEKSTTGDPRSPSGFVWAPRNPSPELEADFLRRMMLRFGTTEAVAKAQLANPMVIPPKAELRNNPNGLNTLVVNEGFDQARRRVALAIDRSGFSIEDRDVSKGTFDVKYSRVVAEEELSWFRRTFTNEKDRREAAQKFRILVDPLNSQSLVSIRAIDGSATASDLNNKMMTVLFEELR